MDPLTHALSGALLARAAARSPRQLLQNGRHISPKLPLRLQITAGFVAAAFPDIDFALRIIDTLTYLNWHQGPTHSLILLPAWAWLIARLMAACYRDYTWQLFFYPACLGLGIHIAGDLFTAYGLMLFAPFSTARYALPLVFVLDYGFTLIIVTGLILSWRFPHQRTAAIAALGGLCLYLVWLSLVHQQAVAAAQHYVTMQRLTHAVIHALPQPLSPLHWKLIVQQREHYHVTLIRLHQIGRFSSDTAATAQPISSVTSERSGPIGLSELPELIKAMAAAYQPVQHARWQRHDQFGDDMQQRDAARDAWNQPAFEPFRLFAAFPVLERTEKRNQSTGTDTKGDTPADTEAENQICYWFYDMRFQFPALPPSFRYGSCKRHDRTDWQLERYRGLFFID